MKVTAYVRDHGVICYEAVVSDGEPATMALPQQLLTTGLWWYWESALEGPDATGPIFADVRPMTRLAPENASAFLADLVERDINEDRRYIALYGVDPGIVLPPVEDVQLADMMQRFAERGEGPIRIIIQRLSVSPELYIFVPHEPTVAVTSLLAQWGIVATAVRGFRNYRRLGARQLENFVRATRETAVQHQSLSGWPEGRSITKP